MDKTIKDWRELDFSQVDFASGDWSWGGDPQRSDKYFITHYADDEGTEICYPVPECIGEMLANQYKAGGRDALRRVRQALNAF